LATARIIARVAANRWRHPAAMLFERFSNMTLPDPASVSRSLMVRCEVIDNQGKLRGTPSDEEGTLGDLKPLEKRYLIPRSGRHTITSRRCPWPE